MGAFSLIVVINLLNRSAMAIHYETAPMMYPPQVMQPHFNMPPVVPPPGSGILPAPTAQQGSGDAKESTVFVGNICETAPDDMIRAMLNTCGYIQNWKRAQGSSGKLQCFGFCTYLNPESAIRAIKMLHNLEVGEKQLTVKVDDSTKQYLETYKTKKPEGEGGATEEDDQDKYVQEALISILKNAKMRVPRKRVNDSDDEGDGGKEKENRSGSNERDEKSSGGLKPYQYTARNPKMDLDELDVDDSKKKLIGQEISKFRESYKVSYDFLSFFAVFVRAPLRVPSLRHQTLKLSKM